MEVARRALRGIFFSPLLDSGWWILDGGICFDLWLDLDLALAREREEKEGRLGDVGVGEIEIEIEIDWGGVDW